MPDPLTKDDLDPTETREWLDALDAVIEREGPERAHFLIGSLIEKARRSGAYLPYSAHTAHVNTIAPAHEAKRPGDPALERRIKSLIRWNAMAMVVRANRKHPGLGGHLASYASAATLYEVGFNHFFRAPSAEHGGDLIYYQGHSAPGIYARAFLEGRLSEEQVEHFRRETEGLGLPAYPHPRLLRGFWQFATVSMGLGPLMAIYQARFLKYLERRGLTPEEDRKVWAFLGDGEMDEPESLGAISLAVREKLDNLIFVINCNLQRLDGPVRGNGHIIRELEAVFRGAGWNVIKVIWGANWDPIFARDHSGILRQHMEELVDGEYQVFKARDGAYAREHFFNRDPKLAELVADLTDDDLWRLKRGGHDPDKVYAAYAAATKHRGQPTVILAHTVKGYGMGVAGEGQNPTHQQKKMGEEALRAFRDRFNVPVSDQDVAEARLFRPREGPVLDYLRERRQALGGPLPSSCRLAPPLEVPELDAFQPLLEGSDERESSTTMAFVRALTALCRDKNIGRNVVPIISDEARTFGMEGMFRQLAIYAPFGQLYKPVDADQLMYYREDAKGQILQEGITEAGSIASWIAAGVSHCTNGIHMVPFYIFYSMFGFQRVGDFIWAAGDMLARGFLIGATSGRTTLNGEGLQHEDGHSHVLASTVPNCIAYDPTYAYELAVILQDGLRRMYGDDEGVFYYITTLNENYRQPPMPEGAEEGIRRGMYRLRKAKAGSEKKTRVRLLGSGAILREALAAADLLEEDFGVGAEVWSVTSFTELRRDGMRCERWNMLHPERKAKRSYVEQCLGGHSGPVIATTDYIRTFADQIRAFVPARYSVLGTDGFGRSDTREALRRFFEVDRHYVVVAALKALADEELVPPEKVTEAIRRYDVNPGKPDPTTV